MPRLEFDLTPFASTFTTEAGEYYGLAADRDIKELVGDPKARLLFTEHQVKVAYDRWVREGKPKFVDEKDRLAAVIKVKNTIIKDMEAEIKQLKSRKRRGILGWLLGR